MSRTVVKYRFFVSAALGMEEEAAAEIQEVWGELLDLDGRPHSTPLEEFEVEKGGITFSASLHLGLQLNFFLKTPHRILLRIKEFRCRDFPKLFSEMQKLNLKEYSDLSNWKLEVAASKSRLNHEGRIEDTMMKALKLKEPLAHEALAGEIYVRFFDDNCSVSLDTTGEHLHFRGGDLHKGDAPLRETLAAFCLRKMTAGMGQTEISKIQWYDPMVGSGTFLLEVVQLFKFNSKRSFAFQSWKKTPKVLQKSETWLKNYPQASKETYKIFGSDIGAKMIEVTKQNFLRQGLQEPRLEVHDILRFRPSFELDVKSPLWVVLNPPYGERIEAGFLPSELLSAITERLKPERVGVLFSRKQVQQLASKLKGYDLLAEHSISNGGLPCVFMIWTRQ